MDEKEVEEASTLLQPQRCPSPFLEIQCRSSGKIRRFSVGTEASFALQLINQKLVDGVPSASYIEAYKEGEEPICFGPNSVLIDYGDGWNLQTVANEGSKWHRGTEFNQYADRPIAYEPTKDNNEFLNGEQFQLEDPLQEVEKPLTSEPVSDIESHSEKLDMTDLFTTNTIFNSREELVKWTRDIGKSVGSVITIQKSDLGVSGRTPRIVFACERSGRYRVARRGPMKKLPVRRMGTKKCDCPFTLKGIKMPKDDQWIVKVDCGYHNHPLTRDLEGYPCGGRLGPEEEGIVLELSKSGVKPREILNVLKERDEQSVASVSCIYNVRQKFKVAKSRRVEDGEACEETDGYDLDNSYV